MKTPDKFTAIIVDDELFGRENLRQVLETYCPEVEILGLADSVVQAKKLVSSFHPEVVFLDIHMPVLDGFDFLAEFDERNFSAVLVSAHEEFGIRAVKAGVADYILKPIDIKELKRCVKRLFLLRNAKMDAVYPLLHDKLVIPASHGFQVLEMDEIVRLEADGCYTTVFLTDGKKTLVSRTLKDFEEPLPKGKFFRVHKSHLINLQFIKDYSNLSGSSVTMTDGSRIEVSRRKAPEFIQKIKTLLKSV